MLEIPFYAVISIKVATYAVRFHQVLQQQKYCAQFLQGYLSAEH